LNRETLRKIGLKKYLKNNIIDTSAEVDKICIDVGLSTEAPYSGMWLSNDPERCVIGIEPLELHWDGLNGKLDVGDVGTRWPTTRLNTNSIIFRNSKLSNISNRFFGLTCAIDDVLKPEKRSFYHMHNPGSSSLLKPSELHTSSIKKVETVQCVSLQDILDYVDWEKFKFIEHVKIDCEGHELSVIKSIGKYLKKIVFFTIEMSEFNQGHWEEQCDPVEIMHILCNNGFRCFKIDDGNSLWLNEEIARRNKTKWLGWIERQGRPAVLIKDSDTSIIYYHDFIDEVDLSSHYVFMEEDRK